MSLGRNFLSAILAEKKVSAFLRLGSIDHLFKPTEKPAFDFVKNFVTAHAALPKPETLEKETGEVLGEESPEPASYYLGHLQTRWKQTTLKVIMGEAHKLLGEGHVDKAVEAVMTGAMDLLRKRFARQLVDLRDAKEPIWKAYSANWKDAGPRLMLGWPTLDDATQGLRTGDVVAYVGRPGIGKTWQMLYGALHGWQKAEEDPDDAEGSSRLFISMEMDPLSIMQRLAAMFTHLNVGNIKSGSLDDMEADELLQGLVKLQGAKAPFWIVDGNLTATVEDVEMLCRHLKPDAVFIDGAYLLRNNNERDRYKRVAENADLIKQRIAAEFCPVVCSWQFNREAAKKKKNEDVTLDDIAYADAVGQVSSLVIGIFDVEDVETIKQRRVKVLKGRSGETGEFYTKWDFKGMDFSEVKPKEVEELHVD